MERRLRLTTAQYAAIIEFNRQRYSAYGAEYAEPTAETDDDLGSPDLL